MFKKRAASQSAESLIIPTFATIKSSQSDYSYPKYPKSYQDFIPTFKFKGLQTTVMLADLWSVLEALVDEASVEAKTAFEKIMNSLPTDKFIPVRTTDKARLNERLLVNPWYIFIDQEEGIRLRPFFAKAIDRSLKNGEPNYLQAIDGVLSRLCQIPVSAPNLSAKEQERYPVVHDQAISSEILLLIIDVYVNQQLPPLTENENAFIWKEQITEQTKQQEKNKAEMLRLETSIPEKSATIKELERKIAKESVVAEAKQNQVSYENERIKKAIESKRIEIQELEDKILLEKNEHKKMEAEGLEAQRLLLKVDNNFQILKYDENTQTIELEDTKRNYDKATRMTSWMTQKVDMFRAEIIAQLNDNVVDAKVTPVIATEKMSPLQSAMPLPVLPTKFSPAKETEKTNDVVGANKISPDKSLSSTSLTATISPVKDRMTKALALKTNVPWPPPPPPPLPLQEKVGTPTSSPEKVKTPLSAAYNRVSGVLQQQCEEEKTVMRGKDRPPPPSPQKKAGAGPQPPVHL